ncbi:MAG: hypothetical protein WBH86_14225 [Thermogutta sp.]|nr:hypothetical protein [Thermogutta sp.]
MGEDVETSYWRTGPRGNINIGIGMAIAASRVCESFDGHRPARGHGRDP